jgi:hypothetical protein
LESGLVTGERMGCGGSPERARADTIEIVAKSMIPRFVKARRGIIFFSLIILSALDGSPVWVESTQVIIIRTHSKECGPGTGAVIRVGTVALCVKESESTIRQKIYEAK